jgi:hypothetical protein
MRSIDDIRTENLQNLAAEHKGTGGLAKALGKKPSQISMWLNRTTSNGRARAISGPSCRAAELLLGKPPGWMDVDHSVSPMTGDGVYAMFRELSLEERVKFLQMLASGSASKSGPDA